jgi:23S rRNA G2069 N7-methylase RlmK/C1962 C5-methylase RlmI
VVDRYGDTLVAQFGSAGAAAEAQRFRMPRPPSSSA